MRSIPLLISIRENTREHSIDKLTKIQTSVVSRMLRVCYLKRYRVTVRLYCHFYLFRNVLTDDLDKCLQVNTLGIRVKV